MKENKLTFLPVDHIPEEDNLHNKEKVKQQIPSLEEQFLRDEEHRKNLGLKDYGLLNDLNNKSDVPDKLIYSDGMMYAFVWQYYPDVDDADWEHLNGQGAYALWCAPVGEMHLDDWTEVSDLTGVAVFTYQRLRDTAIAIGWIRNSNDDWLI